MNNEIFEKLEKVTKESVSQSVSQSVSISSEK